jgi:uncharacterized protein (TIGR00255 family)
MTGFGRATVEADANHGRLRIEIRSVNHRGLDLKIRARQPDAYCDAEIGRAVRAAVERGAITVHIRDEVTAASSGIDEARVRSVHGALSRLRDELRVQEPVGLRTVAAFMSAGGAPELEGEAFWEALRPGVERALVELTATRRREGAALTEDIRGRLARLRQLVVQIRSAAAPLAERFAHRIEDRLAGLRGQAGFEPARIAQEAALMAERLDVSEELVRLDTHLGHLEELAGAAGAVGRKVDFVVQEVGRELNTIGSKSQDAGVAGLVIEGKAELEKLREQAQNIE